MRLRFGLEVNKDVLASLYLVSGIFVDDEITTENIKITRIGEKRHLPCCENGVMLYLVNEHDFKSSTCFCIITVTQPWPMTLIFD